MAENVECLVTGAGGGIGSVRAVQSWNSSSATARPCDSPKQCITNSSSKEHCDQWPRVLLSVFAKNDSMTFSKSVISGRVTFFVSCSLILRTSLNVLWHLQQTYS
jgi:hypothetical protein